MVDIDAIQTELRTRELDAWLFFDHHHRDPIARRILGLPAAGLATRRWFYLVPAEGEPVRLVHRIEAGVLDGLPGERRFYAGWRELDHELRRLIAGLGPRPVIAMHYSPGGALPAISLVDAGTVEQVRTLGAEVASAGDLITRFDAVWTPEMLTSHRAAGAVIDAAIRGAFAAVRRALDQGRTLTEAGLQAWIVGQLHQGGLLVEEPPIVAVNAHAGDPHFQTGGPRDDGGGDTAIAAGDLLLLDVWAKCATPGAAYYDVTWVGYCLRPGETAPPAALERVFALACAARDAAIDLVSATVAAGGRPRGCDVDRAARAVIEAAGLGRFFTHRTGHSLGVEVHASGPNLDDFETQDVRELVPGCAFTVEPGIYAPQGAPFGVRTEINMYIGANGAEVTGPRQQEIVRI